MSDERFKVDYEVGVLDTKTNEIICDTLNAEEVVALLNEQQSTISALKEENDILKQKLRKNYIANKQYEEMKRLQEENEQLKKEHKIAIDEMITDYKNLEKENEQLRKEHQEMLEKYVLLRLKMGEVLNDE